MSGKLRLLSSLCGGLCLMLHGLICNSEAQTPNSNPRNDPNAASSDLAGQGGPGFINNPANRPPYNMPENKISDQQFIEYAVMRGLAHIEIGRLAEEKASTDALKKLGRKMVEDHTKINARLGRLAGKEGMAVPGSLDSKHQARVDRLAKLTGAEFDRAYIKDQLKSQQRDVDAFELESLDGTDNAVKSFALKTIPDVQQHLQMLKDVDKTKTARK